MYALTSLYYGPLIYNGRGALGLCANYEADIMQPCRPACSRSKLLLHGHIHHSLMAGTVDIAC